MKTRCLVLAVLLVALLAATSAPAQTAPQFIRQFGSVDYDYAVKTTTDTQGNVYVAGMTRSTLDAPSQAVPNRNSGGADIFVAKFDPRGDLLWVTQFGSAADDSIGGIAVGTQNGFLSLFVAGSTLGDMPGGADGYVNVSAGGSDLFLAKIHPESGTLRWVRQYGTSGDDVAQGIAVDVSCMVFLAGSTTGSLDGTAAPGNVEEAFLMKLNASGDRMGTLQFNIDSNPLGSAARAVALEYPDRANPLIYVAGSVPGNEQGSLFVARISWDLDLLGTRPAGRAQPGQRQRQGPGNGRGRKPQRRGRGLLAGEFRGRRLFRCRGHHRREIRPASEPALGSAIWNRRARCRLRGRRRRRGEHLRHGCHRIVRRRKGS